MIKNEITIRIPFLWGKSYFKKTYWSQINLIVGPNGSGKTILCEKITQEFQKKGFSINNEKNNTKNIAILKQNPLIKTKIEKILSGMFGKSITFVEDIDKTLIPIVINKAWNVQYMLEEVECHGLKEIISLLIKLYTNTKDILIFDEPELHLHPQFQVFFMNEIKIEIKKNPKKMIFIISHSPYFIDLRVSEDLTGVIVCHTNKVPTHIEKLTNEDNALFKRFLPRFNTYHKQFFFSDNQIFVEGYTDQQMFTNLLPFINEEYTNSGTGIIDVGGKDELGVFFKVCALLGTNGRIITDLDSLFSGKLREVFCKDERVNNWLNKLSEKQFPFYNKIFTQKELQDSINLYKLILKLESLLIPIGNQLQKLTNNTPKKLKTFITKIIDLKQKYPNAETIDTYKTVILQGILKEEEQLKKTLPEKLSKTIPYIKNLYSIILAAVESCRVYILPKGCIEHYYTQNKIEYMPISAKDRLFHNEIEYFIKNQPKQIKKNYYELISILEKACKL